MKPLNALARRFANLMLLTLLAVGFTACTSNVVGTEAPEETDLISVASSPDFTTLAQALEAAQLTATLRTDGPFTVFAPTNEAFAKLPESAIRTLLLPQNRTQLAELLTAHVVTGRVYASEVFELSSAKSLQGSDLNFRQEGDALFVNEARITNIDLEASNGVIHVIDTVILPEWFDEWVVRSQTAPIPLEDR